ncbi:GDSL esterase/lipase At4g10955-like isoform X3 [Phoenix dactylifera]|uniref:GDSL esterase/lipase At4g10955-like isoform X3 n=1 Tax=Phoenix dactylifera TaxID=42345 RepID=A0A8B9AUM2_PHODC|nr:GDSL esterase/lipase At4g10955-like isoform X3 [Phoenix dactylifera]
MPSEITGRRARCRRYGIRCRRLPSSGGRNCPHHQRSIAATLVQGAYVLEHDRQKNRHGPEACAPAWWENFHFELIRKLVDVDDFSIFGAIYEFKSPSSIQNSSNGNAPKFVIAFRAVRNLVSAGGQNVWLAGHSLGSAITTLAGKNMAKTGINLRTFLFNPPFISAPLERIKEEKVKQGIRIAKSFITAGLAVAVRGHDNSSEGSFAMLASWVPNLFVNPADVICSEYIGYFEHRKTMEKIGAGHIEKLATQTSGRHMVRSLFLSEPGKESEPLRLLPSARLTRNLSPSPDFRQAHGIRQWWEPDLNLQCEEYIYN